MRMNLLSGLLLLVFLTFQTKSGEANCFTCNGIPDDAYCQDTVCQYIIINDFECNMFRSEKGNCDITIE